MPEHKISPTDFHLLRKEMEAQGELLEAERLERKAQVEEMRIQLEAFRRALDQADPGFLARYQDIYQDLLQNYNPELDRKAS